MAELETQPTEKASQLSEEEIHGVLSNERRRIVIEYLHESGETVDARELSERIAAIETGENPPPRNIRQSAYVSLHQTHLPKLDELGIIKYDTTSKRVGLQERVDQVTVYMEMVPKYGISWSEYYIGLTIAALLTITSSQIGVPVLSLLSGGVWAYLFLALIGVSAAYQTYQQGSSILNRLAE